MKLTMRETYEFDFRDKMKFDPIPDETLWKKYTDGRVSGVLSEELVKAIFDGLSLAPSAGSSYDLMDDSDRKYECRTVTKGGVSLLPSNQIGTGRKKNEKAYQEKRDMLYAYIFVDVRHSPEFYITAIEVGTIPQKDKLSPTQFDKLLDEVAN